MPDSEIEQREANLDAKLTIIHKRINDIAALEARKARLTGAEAELYNEKMRLLARAEEIQLN